MRESIPDRISLFLNRLKEHGFEAYLVGGSVRDYILGKKPTDYDISTNATVEDILRVFKNYHILNKHRVKHNTVFIKRHEEQVDVTAFRCEEDYTINGDLRMRDFTINALAYGDDFIDPLNGREDIENKIIRACDFDMFLEDPLRMLRGIRFASTLGFEIEEETKKIIKTNYSLLSKVGVQRIMTELCLILNGDYVSNVMNEYWEVFCYLIPELNSTIKYNENLDEVEFFLYRLLVKKISEVKKDYILRTAILILYAVNCHYFLNEKNSPKVISDRCDICIKILDKLCFDVSDKKEIIYLIENLDKRIFDDDDVRKLITRTPCGKKESIYRLLDFKIALNRKIANYDKIIDIVNRLKAKSFDINRLAVTMADITGFALGKSKTNILLLKILDLVFDGKLQNNKKVILKYIKKNLDALTS